MFVACFCVFFSFAPIAQPDRAADLQCFKGVYSRSLENAIVALFSRRFLLYRRLSGIAVNARKRLRIVVVQPPFIFADVRKVRTLSSRHVARVGRDSAWEENVAASAQAGSYAADGRLEGIHAAATVVAM